MNDTKLIAALEEVAAKLDITVSYERIKKHTGRQPRGGLCYVEGEPRIIVHKALPDSEKAQVLIEALRQLDLEDIFIAPELRQTIQGISLIK